jgi:serine/threonine-protein kinase RsbT
VWQATSISGRVIPVRVAEDAAAASALARRAAAALGLSPRACSEVAIAVSELASNQVRHAGGGVIALYADGDALVVEALDRGPGIPDVTAAMLDNASGGRPRPCGELPRGGLGCGLGAVARLMDELRLEGREGGGLCARAVKRPPRRR